jgi:hypothetical protein
LPGTLSWAGRAGLGMGLSTVGCSVSDGALWLAWVCSVRRVGGGGALGLCGALGMSDVPVMVGV